VCGPSRSEAFLLICILLTVPYVRSDEVEPRTDENGIIRLLHVGKAWLRPYYPATVWVQDPRIKYYPVPSHAWSMGKEAFRMLRLYLPRTEESLYQDFDIIVEDGMDAEDLPHDFHHWMKKAVQEKGLGFLMADDSSSFATSGRHTSWYLFPIADVLPVTDVPQIFYPEHAYHILVESEYEGHPLMRNIPWDEMEVWAHNRPIEKEGATVLARMSPELWCNRGKPVICYWDYGKGRAMVYVHKWNGAPSGPGDIAGTQDFYRWKWHFDVLCHLVYFPARVKIPQDLGLVHNIRVLFDSFHYKKAYLIATIDFADKFGANLRCVEAKLAEVVKDKETVDKEYIVEDLDNCRGHLNRLIKELDGLTAEVLEAKDRALLWIFVAEWFTVSGTSMTAGFVVWSLMVRRRLYREAGVTRLIER